MAAAGPMSVELQGVLNTRPDEGVMSSGQGAGANQSRQPVPVSRNEEGQHKRRGSRASQDNASEGGGERRQEHRRSRSDATDRTSASPAPTQQQQRPEQQRDPRTLAEMYDRLIMGIIRPPRMAYEYPRALGPEVAVLPCGVRTERTDFEVVNARGHRLQCSVWRPEGLEETHWPCVVCLHGNSSSRLEAAKTNVIQAAMLARCALVAFDFAGCGNSDGDVISLGHYEAEDTGDVLLRLKAMGAGPLVLWGRSMGAVTALLYACSTFEPQPAHPNKKGKKLKRKQGPPEQPLPQPAGIILDSPFSSFKQLALDLTSRGMVRIPHFATSAVLGLIRRSVRKRAGFDLYKLKPLARVSRCMCPALFLVAEGDELIPPWHGETLQAKYGGPSMGLRFDGTHNSSRPGAVYSAALLFLDAVTRRQGHDPKHALHLLHKTAVITAQEEEEAGAHNRHPYRYDGRAPSFPHLGNVISNFAGAGLTLVATLDGVLAAKKAEDYLLEEMLEAAVTLVHCQLTTARHKGQDTPQVDSTDEVRRTQLAFAMTHTASPRIAPKFRRPTTWERVIDREAKSQRIEDECAAVLETLRRLKMGDVALSPPDSVRTTSTAPLASKRGAWPQLSPLKKDQDKGLEGATIINVSGSGGGASPNNHAARHNNHGPTQEEPMGGERCVQRCEVKGLRLCCFDPRDAMLSGLSREEHLADVARCFWGDEEGEGDQPERRQTFVEALEMTPPASLKQAKSQGRLQIGDTETLQSV